MATNLYHHLSFMPATERWEMPPALEALAQALVNSGKLRINADAARNFVMLGETSFTARELTDPALAKRSDEKIRTHVAPAEGEQAVAERRAYLHRELKKARGVDPAKELRVARVFVQAAHPSVMQLVIESGAEVFISYSHNVADLMPLHAWKTHGENSGLQATDSDGASLYVSCGGDPFFEGEQKTYLTDGFPALARMMVIAGQELGHFADLHRTPRGMIGRHSTDPHASQLRANPLVRTAREADQKTVTRLALCYQKAGLRPLRRAETGVAFYHKRWRFSPPWLFYQSWRAVAALWFMAQCRRLKLCRHFPVIPRIPLGEAVTQYLGDMAFNLAPDADVYRHPDPLVEEAIACIEAVGRVPQQVHKWGHPAVVFSWPELYGFYFHTIIPSCNRALNAPAPHPVHLGRMQRIAIALRRALRPKPGYYP